MVRKVLFVDDDQILQITIQKRLSLFGKQFSIVFASDGFEAIKLLEENLFSIVIIDLIMPRVDGGALLRHVREHFPEIPAIVISSLSQEDMQRLVPSAGVIEYLTKPIQPEDLSGYIMDALQKEADGGIMRNVSPPMFFQFMEMDAKTCTIRVIDSHSHQGSILYFNEGQLLDARVGRLTGVDAALKVFSWDEVTVFIQSDCQQIENNVNMELQSLIMQAVSMKDEEAGLLYPDDEGSPALAVDDDLGLSAEHLDGGSTGQISSISSLNTLKTLIQQIEGDNQIERISHDNSLAGAVRSLEELGLLSEIGDLQAGYIEGGAGKGTYILPEQPAITVTTKASSAVHKIFQKFSTQEKH